MLSDWKTMSLHDGYENWRQREFKNLSNSVQKNFYRLMNTKKCRRTKVLAMHNTEPCGWGEKKSLIYFFGNNLTFQT